MTMKPSCKLIEQSGDLFNLIAITRKTLRDNELQQEAEQFDQRLNDIIENSGNFVEILDLILDFVTAE